MKAGNVLLMAVLNIVLANTALAESPVKENKSASEHVTLNFSHAIPDIPGKSLVAVEVDYPPGAASPAHRHAKSAFIYGYVVSGRIQTQIEGQPVHIYKTGESFFEAPGSHHLTGRNVSNTEPARLLAVFVVDTKEKVLTIPDK